MKDIIILIMLGVFILAFSTLVFVINKKEVKRIIKEFNDFIKRIFDE